jgi:hypothetical protein
VDIDLVVAIIAGVALVIGAAIGAPRVLRDPLNSIVKLVEIWDRLPDSSAAKQQILDRIEQQVSQLDTEDRARRNGPGIALAVVFYVLAFSSGWFIVSAGGLWWIGSAVPLFILICAIILTSQNATKVPRASNGQTLQYQKEQLEKAAIKARASSK